MDLHTNYVLSIFGTAVLIMSQCESCAAQQKGASKLLHTYKYETAGVSLEGELTERQVYGPPGYGETPTKDEHDSILILKLPYSITVEPQAGAKKDSANLDIEKDIHEVQVFMNLSSAFRVHQLVGRTVVAVGTLNEAIAPSQYTKVWLDTKTIHQK